jgi:hypothetical protein
VASRSANNGVTVAAAQGETGSGTDRSLATAVALDERPQAAPAAPAVRAGSPRSESPAPARVKPPVVAALDGTTTTAVAESTAATHRSARTSGSASAPPGSVSLTAEELVQHSGLAMRDLRDLERYGLIESFAVGDSAYYDADALVIAQTAAGFLQHGIEARHMRSYKVAVDREAGLFEQIVLPLLKQRNPEARQRARDTVAELVRLGQQMRAVLLSRELRDVSGHG